MPVAPRCQTKGTKPWYLEKKTNMPLTSNDTLWHRLTMQMHW